MSSLGARLEAGLVHDAGLRHLGFRFSDFRFQVSCSGSWVSSIGFALTMSDKGTCSYLRGYGGGLSPSWRRLLHNPIAASIYHTYPVRSSIQPVRTRCCFTMTHMI